MQLEAQTTARGFPAVSIGTLEIAIGIQGAFEVLWLHLYFHYTNEDQPELRASNFMKNYTFNFPK
jgi:hypothetical protein